MFSRIKSKFQNNPLLYYASSIAATWAGVGSLMNSITMAQDYGIVPFILWSIGNTLACIVFGIFAPAIPHLRDVFRSKAMKIIVGLMSIFQIWLNMNGIQAIFEGTAVGGTFGTVLAYVLAVFFIALLFRFGLIRNVLSDDASWIAVYGTAIVLTVGAIIHSRGVMNPLPIGLEAEALAVGAQKALLLIPGAFLYPYFFELLDYNEQNEDGTNGINIRKAFTLGGLLFGLYLGFAFILAWTNFSPVLNVIKAVLVTLVGVSTLSSFLYSVYLTFGRKLGLALNIAAVASWQFLIPLGVMGVWTLMSTIRIYIVGAAIVIALLWYAADRRKAVQRV